MKTPWQWALPCCIALVAAMAAGADTLAIDQFAAGYELNTPGNAPIYQLRLPDSVYRNVTSDTLADLRVLNSDNQVLPHAFRPPVAAQSTITRRIALPLYPLHETGSTGTDQGDLDIQVENNGAIIRIQSGAGTLPSAREAVRSYIVDISDIKGSIRTLEFDISCKDASYIRQASLQYSQDLHRWSTAVSRFTLAELDYGGHSLKKYQLSLPPIKARYLRINWLDFPDGLQLDGINAVIGKTAITAARREQLLLEGQAATTGVKNFQYYSGGPFPVSRVNIVLPETNTLIEAVIQSRSQPSTAWRTRHSGTFYKLQVEDSKLEHSGVEITPTRDRYWQILVENGNGLGSLTPRLQLDWVPAQLVFLARGAVPYKLVFGNSGLHSVQKAVAALLQVLGQQDDPALSARATLGAPLQLKGAAALESPASIPWQRYLLWGILLAGVVLLFAMALGLFKQMERSSKS